MLENERDDVELRSRLLKEEAERLRGRAGVRRTEVWDAMTPEDHLAHLDASRTEMDRGNYHDLPEPSDAGAAQLEDQAQQLEAAAAEIDTFGHHLEEIG